MSQKLSTNCFKWVKQKKNYQNLMKTYNEDDEEDSNTEYFLEVDIDYPKELFNFHKDLPFLPKRKRLKKSKN